MLLVKWPVPSLSQSDVLPTASRYPSPFTSTRETLEPMSIDWLVSVKCPVPSFNRTVLPKKRSR